MESAMRQCIVEGAEEYLSGTNFGFWSLWKHGQAGRERAHRLKFAALNGEMDVWQLIWAVTECPGAKLPNGVLKKLAPVIAGGAGQKDGGENVAQLVRQALWQSHPRNSAVVSNILERLG